MAKTIEPKTVAVNEDRRLYVIPEGNGYSCLGFDVCRKQTSERLQWIAEHIGQIAFMQILPNGPIPQAGSMEFYEMYRHVTNLIRQHFERTGERCDVDLTPELIGLEGKRVEVVDKYGERRRFYVGRSTGWIPCHLEIKRRNSSGGGPVTGAPFKELRVIGSR